MQDRIDVRFPADQFLIGHGSEQDHRTAPAILIGEVPRRAAVFVRERLHHDPTALPGSVSVSSQRKPHTGADLLGTLEVREHAVGERSTLKLDDALLGIATHSRLVEGNRQQAVATKLGDVGGIQRHVPVVGRIAAQRASIGAVGDHQRDRSLAAHLQAEASIELELARQG